MRFEVGHIIVDETGEIQREIIRAHQDYYIWKYPENDKVFDSRNSNDPLFEMSGWKVMEGSKSFGDECDDWMREYEYSRHVSSQGGESFVYTAHDIFSNKPAIHCYMKANGEKKVKVVSSNHYKLFLSLQSGDLMFKHPDIQQWIDVCEHYCTLAQNNPPW